MLAKGRAEAVFFLQLIEGKQVMRRLIWVTIVAILVPAMPHDTARALSSPVIITAVQGAGAAATHEFIEITNTSDQAVDMTDWTIEYSSASGVSTSTLVRLMPPDTSTRLMLAPRASEIFVSNEYSAMFVTNKLGLMTFSAGINHVAGSIILRDAAGVIVDSVGWGAALKYFETAPTVAMKATTYLQRVGADSDDNSRDFVVVSQSDGKILQYGSIEEIFDACQNIEGIQGTAPDGTVIVRGDCLAPFVPVKLRISELLPNPNGADAGHEYIEIVNEDSRDADLADYMLRINNKTYSFPDGEKILAGEFKVWSDDDLGLVFANTTGAGIELVADDKVIDTLPAYADAPIDQTWSRFGEVWSFSNQPSPAALNLLSITLPADEEDASEVVNQGCKEGYYRNELTNRCRKLPATYQLTPCKEGQYRNEETGRCRSILQAVSSTLKPCADDQFRNPVTGRCKKIASVEDILEPCKPGYERSPETNRCRKLLVTTMPAASFPVEPIKQVAGSTVMWWTLGGVGMLAVAYASWEWRLEIARLLRRATPFGGR